MSNVAYTGRVDQEFQIPFSEIEAKTGRNKTDPSLVSHYLKYLEQEGIDAEFDAEFRIVVSVDLDTLLLNPSEAQALSDARNAYQMQQV
ncbi:hypothetical protein [Bathymodiolus japonicus methanotrophic gill symbiont]|uniref:hypothetical protein n=1 Tax=Bathymodiolus japonicus methanotrophic gill symbiont TaxID=113269 RepID=UPI001C8EBF11|nr:hypothetical protein [Bathymodiolus japonicus methanotrophic gill symbiont]